MRCSRKAIGCGSRTSAAARSVALSSPRRSILVTHRLTMVGGCLSRKAGKTEVIPACSITTSTSCCTIRVVRASVQLQDCSVPHLQVRGRRPQDAFQSAWLRRRRGNKPWLKGILVDYEWCSGCHTCEMACTVELSHRGFPEGHCGVSCEKRAFIRSARISGPTSTCQSSLTCAISAPSAWPKAKPSRRA